MGRPREFDPEKALDDAMQVFWEHGYDAASLPALLDGMGLTRGSLYKAFKDKKSLFLRVLNRYEIEAVEPAVDLLKDGTRDGLGRIDAVFNRAIDPMRNGDHRGCLLCSAAAGPAAVDHEISEVVHLQLRKMQEGFGVALAQSEAFASARTEVRDETAALLLSLYIGLRVLVRARADPVTIEANTRAIRRILGTPMVS